MLDGQMQIPIQEVFQNLIVIESLKRKAEEHVIETIKAQMPVIGEMGSVLDYEKGYKTKPLKKVQKKKVVVDKDGGYFGEDLDGWDAYCKDYFETHGVYPEGYKPDEIDEVVDLSASSAYAIKPKKAGTKKILVASYESSDDE
jgi:hypothetical protein